MCSQVVYHTVQLIVGSLLLPPLRRYVAGDRSVGSQSVQSEGALLHLAADDEANAEAAVADGMVQHRDGLLDDAPEGKRRWYTATAPLLQPS